MTTTKKFLVSQTVEVTVDETKFTPEFYAEFVATMYPYETLDRHMEHLAQLYARGVVDNGEFIEGYGPAKGMGIKLAVEPFSVEVEELTPPRPQS